MDVQNLRFNEKEEKCGKHLFIGKNNNIGDQKASHIPPSGQRKADILMFRGDCLGRYSTAKTWAVLPS